MIFKKAPIVSLQGQAVLLFTEQQTLLQALEAKKVTTFSECRNGFCGACKTKINCGEVRYISEPIAELQQGECLPCCCVPETDLDLDLSPIGAEVVVSHRANMNILSSLNDKVANTALKQTKQKTSKQSLPSDALVDEC